MTASGSHCRKRYSVIACTKYDIRGFVSFCRGSRRKCPLVSGNAQGWSVTRPAMAASRPRGRLGVLRCSPIKSYHACHDLVYGELLPAEGGDIRGLSQPDYLGYVLVRRSTGQAPLPVDGTSRYMGLRSRPTRRDLSTDQWLPPFASMEHVFQTYWYHNRCVGI